MVQEVSSNRCCGAPPRDHPPIFGTEDLPADLSQPGSSPGSTPPLKARSIPGLLNVEVHSPKALPQLEVRCLWRHTLAQVSLVGLSEDLLWLQDGPSAHPHVLLLHLHTSLQPTARFMGHTTHGVCCWLAHAWWWRQYHTYSYYWSK